MIYLDNAATTFPKPEEVYKALDYANRNLAFNAGRGTYENAVKAADYIYKTREVLSSLINASPNNVVFTATATEALNTIIYGLNIKEGDNIYISPFEHNAIVRPLYEIKKNINFNILIIPFSKKTLDIDEEKLKDLLILNPPKAVFISHVSNVTGQILPYTNIFNIFKSYKSCCKVLDSAQSFGLINPNTENVDFIIFDGHKTLYSAMGIAGFLNLTNFNLKITRAGGNGSDSKNHYMPDDGFGKFESGTQNIVAIYSLLKSINWLKKENVLEKINSLWNYLYKNLSKIENINLYVNKNQKYLGIISFNIEGYSSSDVANILYKDCKICIRGGYHCSPFVHDLIESNRFNGTARISLSFFNTLKELDILIEALKSLSYEF